MQMEDQVNHPGVDEDEPEAERPRHPIGPPGEAEGGEEHRDTEQGDTKAEYHAFRSFLSRRSVSAARRRRSPTEDASE